MENLLENLQKGDKEFYFVCSGYLNSILEQEGEYIAKICRIQKLDDSNRNEAIWFNCRVLDPRYKAMLNELQFAVEDGMEIKIQFLGVYRGVKDFQCCLTEEDPDHFVTLKVDFKTLVHYSL